MRYAALALMFPSLAMAEPIQIDASTEIVMTATVVNMAEITEPESLEDAGCVLNEQTRIVEC